MYDVSTIYTVLTSDIRSIAFFVSASSLRSIGVLVNGPLCSVMGWQGFALPFERADDSNVSLARDRPLV